MNLILLILVGFNSGQDLNFGAPGNSVSLSSDGTILAIGASNANGSEVGQVRIYELNNTSWIQKGANIDPSNFWNS